MSLFPINATRGDSSHDNSNDEHVTPENSEDHDDLCNQRFDHENFVFETPSLFFKPTSCTHGSKPLMKTPICSYSLTCSIYFLM